MANSTVENPIRVLCVDDLPDITAVLRMLLDAEAMMQCVGCLSSANNLVEEVRRVGGADGPLVVLLDATMPGKDPFEAMAELSRRLPHVKTIVYSGYDDQEFIDNALQAGAWGCISKNDPPETIMDAVREVAAGNAFFPRRGERTLHHQRQAVSPEGAPVPGQSRASASS